MNIEMGYLACELEDILNSIDHAKRKIKENTNFRREEEVEKWTNVLNANKADLLKTIGKILNAVNKD